MTTRVKICGLTREQDVAAAVACVADSIGSAFDGPGRRSVSIAQAKMLVARVPAFVTVTGLFVSPDSEFVESVLESVPLDLLQFHGDESAAFCASFGRRWIKAIRVREAGQIQQAFTDYSQAEIGRAHV